MDVRNGKNLCLPKKRNCYDTETSPRINGTDQQNGRRTRNHSVMENFYNSPLEFSS
jgi:hypothetical protein